MSWELLIIAIAWFIILAAKPGTPRPMETRKPRNKSGTPRIRVIRPNAGNSPDIVIPRNPNPLSTTQLDAIAGLRSLGFDKETATARIRELPDSMDLETMIKRGLQQQ